MAFFRVKQAWRRSHWPRGGIIRSLARSRLAAPALDRLSPRPGCVEGTPGPIRSPSFRTTGRC